MAQLKGKTWDGVEYTIDLSLDRDLSPEALKQGAAEVGAFDNVVLLPCIENSLESETDPGFIEAIPAAGIPLFYHPIKKDGLPDFDILLTQAGKQVSPSK